MPIVFNILEGKELEGIKEVMNCKFPNDKTSATDGREFSEATNEVQTLTLSFKNSLSTMYFLSCHVCEYISSGPW